MPDFLDRFPGEKEREITMVPSKAVARNLEDPKNTFLWGALPRGIKPAKVKRLSFFDSLGSKKELPESFSEFRSLVCLTVPLHLVPKLPSTLPDSLRTLIVLSGGTAAASLPRALVLPGLERLFADDIKLAFAPEQVPNIRSLRVKVASAKELAVVSGLRKLEGLQIGPVPDTKFWKLLAKLPLRRLFVMRGGLTNLKGVEALTNLEKLTVKGMNGLVDVSAIKGLKKLSEVSFDFCANLGDVRFMATMKALKVITFWGCSDRKQTITKAFPALLAAKKVVDSELLDDLEEDDEVD